MNKKSPTTEEILTSIVKHLLSDSRKPVIDAVVDSFDNTQYDVKDLGAKVFGILDAITTEGKITIYKTE